MAQPPLTAPQLQSLHSHYESQLSKIVSAMNLRKWIVEKMIDKMVPDMDLAERMYQFITSPSLNGLEPPKDESQ